MATLVATSPQPLIMNGMFKSGHKPQSPTYSTPAGPTSAPVDEPMSPVASPTLKPTSKAMASTHVTSETGRYDALVTPLFRGDATAPRQPAKDLAAFNSLLPPPVEFVEGSSSGTYAASLEGRYEPINASPKAAPKALNESQTAAKSTPTKKYQSELKVQQSLYTRSIDLSWPAGIVHGSGLFNQGNTCFLNSALQCLLHTPPLLRILMAHTKAECRVKSGFCMSCAMQEVSSDSFKKGRAFTPLPITRNLNSIAKHLRKGRQEDAHEFLRYAIDSLQKSCLAGYPPKIDHKLAETTWVHKIFGGQLRSRVTCQQCGYNSDTFDSILDLSIDIYNISGLKEALKKFTAKDYLKGADKYKCEKCKRPVNAEKQFTIHEAPAVLTVHLKRFTPMGRKLQHPIRYDEVLSLQPAMSEGQHGPTYKLYGVISHMGGGPNSGHYFAHVRGGDGQWYEMNDDSVERVHKPEPLNMKNAYMLFYIRQKGEALAAAVHGGGFVNGISLSKKRKELSDEADKMDEDEKEKTGSRSFIGPIIPPHLVSRKSNPHSETLQRKIEALEREKEKRVEVQRAESRPLKPLVDYEDEEDDERGEPVERLNSDMTRNNNINERAPPRASTSPVMASSSPTSARSPVLRKDLNGDLRSIASSDRIEGGASSPSRPPPTSPLPTTSPATETIPASSFYGGSGSAAKRKSPDDHDDGVRRSSSSITAGRRSSVIPTGPSAARRSFGGGGLGAGNPYGKSRIGGNLNSDRDRNEFEQLRPRKMHKKQFGSRRKMLF
ncbi:cysteine proteinase [Fomitiporia mediterranea MF3/22]|uniref:cysteine proteinase n=1 Tax=Fomitiporia mediterranea (strain MF3/22) TaxID=694068 RepID=UPI0004407E24|nr:cysteine proteinase [Fomitiporia mediterranea MF3/22]EJD01524.1 cysteine proteinase [Fomitiporia mediterranea MF3/22]